MSIFASSARPLAGLLAFVRRAALPALVCLPAVAQVGTPATAAAEPPRTAAAAAVRPAGKAAPVFDDNVARGFGGLSRDDKVLLMPIDAELFSLSAGGVAEPRADWTASALGHMKKAIAARKLRWGLNSIEFTEADAETHAELVGLHAAVASSIALHFGVGGIWKLPTKEGWLDWSFGDAMRPLQAQSGARYALFVRVRDSYASAERKAAMVALALIGIGIGGGVQTGYASLVDLDDGRVVWFNRIARPGGDLREEKAAMESIDTLLGGFPAVP